VTGPSASSHSRTGVVLVTCVNVLECGRKPQSRDSLHTTTQHHRAHGAPLLTNLNIFLRRVGSRKRHLAEGRTPTNPVVKSARQSPTRKGIIMRKTTDHRNPEEKRLVGTANPEKRIVEALAYQLWIQRGCQARSGKAITKRSIARGVTTTGFEAGARRLSLDGNLRHPDFLFGCRDSDRVSLATHSSELASDLWFAPASLQPCSKGPVR
jgi:hypothetical protein